MKRLVLSDIGEQIFLRLIARLDAKQSQDIIDLLQSPKNLAGEIDSNRKYGLSVIKNILSAYVRYDEVGANKKQVSNDQMAIDISKETGFNEAVVRSSIAIGMDVLRRTHIWDH